MPKNIVLIEPDYYTQFPPIGLLKLSSYHKAKGDNVELVNKSKFVKKKPDKAYVTSLFTWAWKPVWSAVRLYKAWFPDLEIWLGGLYASLLPDHAKLSGADVVFEGLFDGAEEMMPDYSIVPDWDGSIIMASRGCPFCCDFCYKESFWGREYYEFRPLAEIARELDTFQHRFVFFLDDNLLGDRKEARQLFALLRGYDFVWQAAASLDAAYAPGFLQEAYRSGCRSLFVGFESINKANMERTHKPQNQKHDYADAIERFHDADIMINGSFVYGFDDDDPAVFARTIEFAIEQKIETATFHILTPFPGTRMFAQLDREGRLRHRDWDKYDTRHAVFQPRRMSPAQLEEGYRWSYEQFYRYGSILRRSVGLPNPLKRFLYNVGWKKMDSVWDFILAHNLIDRVLPAFEYALARDTSPRTHHADSVWRQRTAVAGGCRREGSWGREAGVDGSRTHHG